LIAAFGIAMGLYLIMATQFNLRVKPLIIFNHPVSAH